MFKNYTILFSILSTLSGCAAVLPDTASVSMDHISHATQHAPIAAVPTNYGVNVASFGVRWGRRDGPFMELSEGVIVDRCTRYEGERQCGALMGPRETFIGRIGYVFTVRNR